MSTAKAATANQLDETVSKLNTYVLNNQSATRTIPPRSSQKYARNDPIRIRNKFIVCDTSFSLAGK